MPRSKCFGSQSTCYSLSFLDLWFMSIMDFVKFLDITSNISSTTISLLFMELQLHTFYTFWICLAIFGYSFLFFSYSYFSLSILVWEVSLGNVLISLILSSMLMSPWKADFIFVYVFLFLAFTFGIFYSFHLYTRIGKSRFTVVCETIYSNIYYYIINTIQL